MQRSSNEWLSVLLHCGVRIKVASSWSPIFAQVIGPDTFSKGDSELDDFLGQILHESDLLEQLEENLYYTTPGLLMKTWPTRFRSLAEEKPYLKNPQALAEKVYGGRLGNAHPGDGWKYRGSGLIQVTGSDNFRALQAASGIPVFDHPELLRAATAESLQVCIAWWNGHVPDSILGDIRKITRIVNGGQTGLAEREKLTSDAKGALS
jgi:putative chitinase